MMYQKFFLALLFLSTWLFQAQAYKPLLDHTNEWHFTTCFFGCLTDIYYTSGDTLVNGKNHKILDGYHYISRSFLLREEVAERKVYMTKINEFSIDEFLLYDFTLEPGDSIDMMNPITPFPLEAGYFTVDSIRLKPLEDGEDYRHYYFSPSESNTISSQNCIWIEGVGSLSLINAPSGEPNLNGVGALSCFFKDGQAFYTNLDSIDACIPTLSNAGNWVETAPLSLLQSESYVAVFPASAVSRLQLYEVNGKKISTLLNMDREERLRFSTEGLSKGVYIVLAEGFLGERTLLKFIKR